MSDPRREAVAKALHAVDVRLREEDGDFGVATAPWDEAGSYTRGIFGEYGDAAIAAMQTEPTEAEIDAGAVALHDFTQEPSGQDRPWAVFPAEYHDLFRERARVVLIAARNAGQGVTE